MSSGAVVNLVIVSITISRTPQALSLKTKNTSIMLKV